MKDKKHARCDAHFQEELDSLKANMARITSLLEQTPRHLSSEGLSNHPVIFTTIHLEERMGGHA